MSSTDLKVFDQNAKVVGSKTVSNSVLGGKVKTPLLHQVVRWQRAKRRAGTHSTLTRAEVSGGGIKPWKQKGTGRARAGSNTSPLWVGGGIPHGPKPRSYEFSLNKKERKQALSSALSARLAEGRLIVIKDFGFEAVKTKEAASLLKTFGITKGESVLVVLPLSDQTALRSFRNIERVKVLPSTGLNVYDVLNSKYVIIAEEEFAKIESRLG